MRSQRLILVALDMEEAFQIRSGAICTGLVRRPNLTCQFLVVGGGLPGLRAAEAAMRRGAYVVVIEKGAFGDEVASPRNAGQFLTGWALWKRGVRRIFQETEAEVIDAV